ncbi:fermitin family homolog 2 [Patella vulgata]|uniref:fermitin family homolog 2 n=1 Tax=Patella vulgata TaxID=6465 RepID=UPI0021808BAA|nr:fermitin family homolog 2 [Patella vulgata]
MAFIADSGRVDGSWTLQITVTDLQVEKVLRVKGDEHVGGVMLRLVEALDIALDWSDHALWWPERNMWLSRTRSTLDQYSVQADAKLQFTPMHKNLRIQLPDLQVLDMRVDFSTKVFATVVHLCKELGIRFPEEMSFLRRLDKDDLKRVVKEATKKKKKDPEAAGPLSSNGHHSSSGSLDGLSPFPSRSPMGPSPSSTLIRSAGSPYNMSGNMSQFNSFNGTISPGSMHSLSFEGVMESTLAISPPVPTKEAFQYLYRPKNFIEKARINCVWLDSSRSLMEQGIRENDFIIFKYKFYSFYDLNPKYDAIRINQIYEQAKWSLMAEETDCTEEEMMMFAALQFQVQLQSGLPQPDLDMTNNMNHTEDDDIDAALKDLQESLEGNSISTPGDITHIPELGDFVRFLKPKKLTLKSYKRYWATFKDTHIAFYRNREDTTAQPLMRYCVRGCEAQPDVNLTAKKYGIKMFVPDADGMTEICLRFDSEEQYCRWMAASKLSSKGKTMADSSYSAEVQALQTFLSMQHTAPTPSINTSNVDIQAEDFVAPRFYKKVKSKTLVQKIMEAHANVREMSLMDSKLAFIKAWQSLPEYGITYFVVKMANGKKEELLGVASNRIIRMDLQTGDSIKTWRYNTLQSWHVNWEVENMILEFEEERVTFACLGAPCKVVHEFIGGYIFLSMRSQDKNQSLNEEMFHKLTGGWS